MTNQSTNARSVPARMPPDRVVITGPGYNPYKPVRALATGKNTAASVALFLGIAGALLAAVPLGSGDQWLWAAPALAAAGALVFGGVGISRSNRWARDDYRAAGRSRAVWGLTLGGLVLVTAIVALIGVALGFAVRL